MNLQIHAFDPARDQAAVTRLYRDFMREITWKAPPIDPIEAPDFTSPGQPVCLLATADGVAAAFISVSGYRYPDGGAESVCTGIYVAPAYRRRGIGRALIHALGERQFADVVPGVPILFRVDPDMPEAAAFYRGAGCSEVRPGTMFQY
jgi:ribosomal protein S18 acetylase RimI-like enzyme